MCAPLLAAAGMSAGAASTVSLIIQGVSAGASALSAIDKSNKQNAAVARNAPSARTLCLLGIGAGGVFLCEIKKAEGRRNYSPRRDNREEKLKLSFQHMIRLISRNV